MNALYENQFLFCPAMEDPWLHWSGTYWRCVKDDSMTIIANEVLRRRHEAAKLAENDALFTCTKSDTRRVNGCISMYKGIVLADISDFNNHPDMLNFQNGVLNLRTGELTPHDPSQRFTYCSPVAYNREADQQSWLDYLITTFSGEWSVIEYLQVLWPGQGRQKHLHGSLPEGTASNTIGNP